MRRGCYFGVGSLFRGGGATKRGLYLMVEAVFRVGVASSGRDCFLKEGSLLRGEPALWGGIVTLRRKRHRGVGNIRVGNIRDRSCGPSPWRGSLLWGEGSLRERWGATLAMGRYFEDRSLLRGGVCVLGGGRRF